MKKNNCKKHPDSPIYISGRTKRCLYCGRERALAWNRNHRQHCIKRNKEYQITKKDMIAKRKKKQYDNNGNGLKKSRIKELKYKYGISLEEYDILFQKQNGVCAICGKNKKEQRGKRNDCLSIDHDHKTGKIRGLLCSTCNWGLGQFRDDPLLLLKAIEYLKKPIPQ